MVAPIVFRQSVPDEPQEEVVLLADGTSLHPQGFVHIPLNIQRYKEMIPAIVVDLSNDYKTILGDT